MKALHAAAAKLPGVTEGIACAGTALESRTLKIGGKAFAFFGPTELRLKLSASLPAAEKLSKTKPGSCVPSASGWTKCAIGQGMLPQATLAKWIYESYRVFAPAPYGTAGDPKSANRPSPARGKKRG